VHISFFRHLAGGGGGGGGRAQLDNVSLILLVFSLTGSCFHSNLDGDMFTPDRHPHTPGATTRTAPSATGWTSPPYLTQIRSRAEGRCSPCLWWWRRLCRRLCATGGCARTVLEALTRHIITPYPTQPRPPLVYLSLVISSTRPSAQVLPCQTQPRLPGFPLLLCIVCECVCLLVSVDRQSSVHQVALLTRTCSRTFCPRRTIRLCEFSKLPDSDLFTG